MSNADRRSGFTLIEMMAVMLIIALVASLVILMTPGSGRAQLKAVTLETAALLRRERVGAILTGHDRQVLLDGRRRLLIGGSGFVAIPRDVALDLLHADGAPSDELAVVRFHPDGASSGAALKFSRERASYEIRVNWYTGGVTIAAP